MNYIELIGPPAVGKTTLLKLLANKTKKDLNWRRYEEAVFDIVDSLKWHQLQNTKSKGLYLADKINFTEYKKLGICNTLIQELTTDISPAIQGKYGYLLDAQLKALVSLDQNISPINKCALLNWHRKALEKLFILETFQYKKTVIFDEGPLKTHFGLDKIDWSQIEKSTLPRAVIYCTINPEENLKRVKMRMAQTGQVNKIHNGLNNKDLEYLVSYTHEIAEKNIAFVKAIGLPVLNVDLTDPIKSSGLSNVRHFLDKYSKMTISSMNSILPHFPELCI